MTIKSNELSIELELLKRKLNGVRAWNWDREFCGWKQLCSTTNSSGLIFLILFQVEIFFLLLFVVVALFSVYSSPEMDDKIHSFRNAKCLFRVYAFQFTFQDWYGTHTLAMRRRTVSEFVHVIRGSKHNIKLLTVSLPHNCVYFFFLLYLCLCEHWIDYKYYSHDIIYLEILFFYPLICFKSNFINNKKNSKLNMHKIKVNEIKVQTASIAWNHTILK